MTYLKNGLFKKWPISKIGLFQKLTYFKNGPILKIGIFQKVRRRHNYWKRDVFFEKKTPQLLETHYTICTDLNN